MQTRSYNPAGQLIQQQDLDANGNLIVQYDYNYDNAGNITQETNQPPEQTFSVANISMTYGAANQLLTINGQSTLFDNDGNLLKVPSQGNLLDLSYDSRNRLTQAGDTTYTYDAENHRLGVDDSQFIINPHAALSQVLVRTKGNGQVTYYVYGLGLIGEQTAGNYFAYHYDLRGSTVALTNDQGQITQRFQYTPYGQLVSGNPQTTPFLYHGMYGVMTDDNGLYYMRARYYSPEIRRFISEDVILGYVAQGQSLNRFAFVQGNPVVYIDPEGRWLGLAMSMVGWGLRAWGWASTAMGTANMLNDIAHGRYPTAEDIAWAVMGIALDRAGGRIAKGLASIKAFKNFCQNQIKKIRDFLKRACFPAGTLVLMADGTAKPIEAVEIGDKVFSASDTQYFAGHIPIDNEDITTETWRSISLSMFKADGSIVNIALLRPLWWLEEVGAEEGGTIYLSMPEVGVSGYANVLKINFYQADFPKSLQQYKTVTGTFTHENATVIDLYFDNDTINPFGVTPNHPLWSISRNSWIEAGNLEIGEFVKTQQDVAQLTTREQRPNLHKVYNLEVHQDHTFYVSSLGVLAHNNCLGDDEIRRASDHLDTIKPGTKKWYDAISELQDLVKGKKDYRVESATDAKNMLENGRGGMNRYKNYTKKPYKKGYETHNVQNERELGVGNDLQHLKWKDGKAGGHIFYNTPN